VASFAAAAIHAVLLMVVLIKMERLASRVQASEEALACVSSSQLQDSEEAARNETYMRQSMARLRDMIRASTNELLERQLRLEDCMRHIEGKFGALVQRTAPCGASASRTSTAPASSRHSTPSEPTLRNSDRRAPRESRALRE